jgi:hypothetical protein
MTRHVLTIAETNANITPNLVQRFTLIIIPIKGVHSINQNTKVLKYGWLRRNFSCTLVL